MRKMSSLGYQMHFWSLERVYLFTLFEAGPNNMKGGGCIQTENIKMSVCSLIYLSHAFTLLGLSSQEVHGGHLSLLGRDIS